MCHSKATRDIKDQQQSILLRKSKSALNQLGQSTARNVFNCQKVMSLIAVGVKDFCDIRILDACQHSGLFLEPPDDNGIPRQSWVQNFYGDNLAVADIYRSKNGPDSPPTKTLE